MLDLWYGLMANLAIVAVFTSLWTHTHGLRERWSRAARSLVLGLHLGVGAVALMMVPVELQQGLILDLRSTFIGLAAFYGGPLAALIATAVAASYRLAAGGIGAWLGCISMVIVALIGLGGQMLLRGRNIERRDIVFLAIAVALGNLSGFALMEPEMRNAVLQQTAVPSVVLNVVSMLLAGLAFVVEDRRRRTEQENLTYRAIIDALPDSLNVKDTDGRFIAANPATARLLGASSVEALIGRTDFDFLPPALATEFRQAERDALAVGEPLNFEQAIQGDDGSTTWLSTLKLPLRDEDGAVTAVVTHNRDISVRKRLKEELVDSRNLLSNALSQMADGVAMFDREGRMVFCNDQYRSYFPITADLRVPGTRFRTILRAAMERGEQIGTPPDQVAAWIDRIADSLNVSGEEEAHMADGRWLHVRTRPSSDGSSMVVVSDITKVKRAETELLALTEQLKLLAATDGLTGLMNRRAFDQSLDAELMRSKRDRSPISMLLVDIDRFKAFNDLYGHPAGDECLRAVSRCFRQNLKRVTDLAARYGGEEFVAILPDTDEDGAFHVAEAFRLALRAMAMPHDGSEKGIVTASVGIATCRPEEPMRRPADLIARADEALYSAKAAGRDRVTGWHQHYEPDTRAIGER